MENIKLIWDFRGPSSQHTAKHFKVHLLAFFEGEQIEWDSCGVEVVNSVFHYTYVISNKIHLELIKSALNPHRAQLVKAV